MRAGVTLARMSETRTEGACLCGRVRYRIVGEESIETALGEIKTIHIEKVRGPDDKRSFEFWVAVEHNHLPVQVRFTDKKGRQFDSVVTSIRYP